jgi:ribose transport system ATP-binding protein
VIENREDVILEFNNISKIFLTSKALTDVSFSLKKGEVHALLGENGAGKSTLLKILSGVFRPDKGEIVYKGSPINIRNPFMAKKFGINLVHQELQLVPELTVGKNIFLGCEPLNKLTRTINWENLYRRSAEILKKLDTEFSSKEYIKNLSTAQMQMVEIAKALQHNSAILALDEPTSSLTSREIEKLFEIIRLLKQDGTTIIYVSHRLEEVFEIADRATILRDGRYIGTYNLKETDKPMLVRLMVGREVTNLMKAERDQAGGERVLEVQNLYVKNKCHNINFFVRKGEILGIAGLVGSGRTETVRAIFGADKGVTGELFVNGKKVRIKTPSDAIKNGIFLIPEDRKLQGFVPILSNKSNISLSSLTKFIRIGILQHQKIKQNAQNYIEKLKINPPGIEVMTRNLSGGNQQKVVLAKCLSSTAKIMIFDEPTRGIDIGAKAEIHKLMERLVGEGCSIIMISSELPEIIEMSDRILIMHEGTINGELSAGEITEEKILHYAMGGK